MKKIILYLALACLGAVLGAGIRSHEEKITYDHPTIQEAFCNGKNEHPNCKLN